jgi:hypothetical protein
MLSLAALRLSAPLAPDTFGTPPFGAVLGRPATSSDAGS